MARLTALNPNPEQGDAHYLLGLTLTRLGRDEDAYEAFAKASWLDASVAAANHQLALIDARHGRDEAALRRADASLRARPDQLHVRNLVVVLLRRLGRADEAARMLHTTLDLDPLDIWARQLAGTLDEDHGHTEAQTLLDIAVDSARCGELATAVGLAERARDADTRRPLGQIACGVLADYHAAAWRDRLGDSAAASTARARARKGDRTWNHAARLDDVLALQAALAADQTDATASALLGHWYYAHGRPTDALACWRRSAELDGSDPVVWRNIALAAYNVDRDAAVATAAYERALQLVPGDPRLLFESDQLLKRIGAATRVRLARLEDHPGALGERDDLAVEYSQLLLAADRPADALGVLDGRRFQPWEGGEGLVLKAWERTRLALADQARRAGDPVVAVAHVRAAIEPPTSLGEARHPLANPARLMLALGDALAAADQPEEARSCWRTAAAAEGDFSEMEPLAYSENSFYSALAASRLGEDAFAAELTVGLARHTETLAATPATIDYFATSLPSMMLFDDDPQRRRDLLLGALRAPAGFARGRPVRGPGRARDRAGRRSESRSCPRPPPPPRTEA